MKTRNVAYIALVEVPFLRVHGVITGPPLTAPTTNPDTRDSARALTCRHSKYCAMLALISSTTRTHICALRRPVKGLELAHIPAPSKCHVTAEISVTLWRSSMSHYSNPHPNPTHAQNKAQQSQNTTFRFVQHVRCDNIARLPVCRALFLLRSLPRRISSYGISRRRVGGDSSYLLQYCNINPAFGAVFDPTVWKQVPTTMYVSRRRTASRGSAKHAHHGHPPIRLTTSESRLTGHHAADKLGKVLMQSS
jgi:hypothetical protein